MLLDSDDEQVSRWINFFDTLKDFLLAVGTKVGGKHGTTMQSTGISTYEFLMAFYRH